MSTARKFDGLTDAGKIAVPLSPRQIIAVRLALSSYLTLHETVLADRENELKQEMIVADEAMRRSVENAMEFAGAMIGLAVS